MAEADTHPEQAEAGGDVQLERGTYEIIRSRLLGHADSLRERLDQLNAARRDVFGAIETKLIGNERITTDNNCIPRDMFAHRGHFLFGYNVNIGLKSETELSDVFAVHRFDGQTFHAEALDFISDATFVEEFQQLYKYYKNTRFAKFFYRAPHLYMVFRVGKSVSDIKAFKWLVKDDELVYLDNRSDHEVTYPPQHDFEWARTHRDLHRAGEHPHISIEDRVFVETVGGDLTIKIEDNTASGEGIYSEEVENKDQVLDDAEVFYAAVGNIILLKIRPYQEDQFRYFVYNEKIQEAQRIDSIKDACQLLPESHGLIFSNGYYLQTGESKTFGTDSSDLLFERSIAAANGEDHLYVFYNRETGDHVLLLYNVIEQRVETPIACHGYASFEDGKIIFFKAGDDPQKHHAIQIWQTPFVGEDYVPATEDDSYLFKIGNKDIVRGMAECHEIIGLINKEDTYGDLYIDLVKKSSDVLDSYFWLDHTETFNLAEVVSEIKQAATAAVDEFDKVVRVRRNTKQQFTDVSQATSKILSSIAARRFEGIEDFVQSLADLRHVRGDIISLQDLRYIDLKAVERLEEDVIEHTDRLSHRCVEFLLQETALAPYEERVTQQRSQIDELTKVADAKKLEEELLNGSSELEMLIDIVSNLKIDDATQRTRIIDKISEIYSGLNQTRAALKKKSQALMSQEGIAEFNSQMKLIGQGVVNYLDVCDTPEKCDEYLTKLMVQIEELEGRFAEFDDFVVQLAEKREEIYGAFDARKLALVEARNKRANSLMNAAERILKGIATRVANFDTINEIHSYFASDLMIEKVRDIIDQLTELEDSVKVDDIQSRLKTVREDAVRQLKDRQELFEGGDNIIRLGRHRFSVNVQELQLTTVLQNDELCYHLTGTKFLEPIEDESLLATRDVWDMQVASENSAVYRGEYLAYKLLLAVVGDEPSSIELPSADELLSFDVDQLTAIVNAFMGPRYTEGYVKGVHDHDAAIILHGLLDMRASLGLLRYDASARALATVYWCSIADSDRQKYWQATLNGMGTLSQVFDSTVGGQAYVSQMEAELAAFCGTSELFPGELAGEAATYLFEELVRDHHLSVSHQAAQIIRAFRTHLERKRFTPQFEESIAELGGHVESQFRLLRNWIMAFVQDEAKDHDSEFAAEAAAVLLDGSLETRHMLHGEPKRALSDLAGNHKLIDGDQYELNFHEFVQRLSTFDGGDVVRFHRYQELKKQLVETKRETLRLEEFKPRVLTSFVRNKLIDEVYLHMIGDNLAKQIGAVGDQKRTDLMGLLLLISPPGYGKTTLMEYVANRLGITFMKINGPAIGHAVTSLDPAEAPNASAREEVEKLNLSLEMGDNVMIYLDDIQHCNPEFLQKFISLCDGQRRIEGVYQGKTRTYDLRGRKVAVVMAGNPYTESGEKFQIPDMLANRADTYNLGDVIGDKQRQFEMSYLENSLTSNPTLNELATRSQKDVYAVIKMAEAGSPEGVDVEGNYSVEELNEFVSVMRKLMRVRDVLLRVNAQYIESAGQADEYRTEPPFKLQGSYRDMNKLAEQVVPIMNDDELETQIYSHYENQAQTLTTGAEANLLKFRELMEQLTLEEEQRWDDIKRTFRRNVMLGNVAGDDKFGQVIAQMTTFSEGLAEIQKTISVGVQQLTADKEVVAEKDGDDQHFERAVAHLADFNQNLVELKDTLSGGLAEARQRSDTSSPGEASLPEIKVVNRVPRAFLDVIETQFQLMRQWFQPLLEVSQDAAGEASRLRQVIDDSVVRYQDLLDKLESAAGQRNKDKK